MCVPRSALDSNLIGQRTLVLVAAPTTAPAVLPATVDELGCWLRDAPWVTYSHELPITRKFWRTALAGPFDADIRLTSSDLRAVATAVELGLGVCLLPRYICDRALTEGRVVSLFDVTGLVPTEPWFATVRRSVAGHLVIRAALESLVTA